MLAPSQLLDVSTQKIQDKNNLVKLCPYKKISTKQGYSFISLNRRKAKEIIASVELNVDWQRDDDIGYFKQVNCKINTREKFKGSNCILYQDAIIFVNDFSSYTESIGQYQYNGRAVSIDKLALIDKKLDSNEVYGYSSLDLIASFDKYTIIPEYLALNDTFVEKGVYLVKVEDSKSLTMLTTNSSGVYQVREDLLKIRALNVSRKNIMNFVKDLLEFGTYEHLFGLIGEYNIKELNNYDDFSNLRGIRYEISLSICYNIYEVNELIEKNITTIMFKIENDKKQNLISNKGEK